MADTFDPAAIAAFVAGVSGVTFLSCGRPEQWGVRRLALGLCALSVASAALLMSFSIWWWSAVLWGVHQMYLGWSYISRRRRTSHERLEYLESSAAVLCYVALTDGIVDQAEVNVMRLTYQRAGFSSQDIAEVIRVIDECQRRFLSDGSDPNRLFTLLQDACAVMMRHSNQQTRLSFLRAAIVIAATDGFVSAGEERSLRASAHWLGIADADYERLWRGVVENTSDNADTAHAESRGDHQERQRESATVPPDLTTYYASVLGVPVTASFTEMKRAYRDKAKQYHPDVVAHQGPAVASEAEEKFKELSRAYEFFRGGAVAL